MTDKINHSEYSQKSPKRRVLFVITQSEFGGAQRFFYDLITNLESEKYDTLLATGRDGATNSFETKGLTTHKLNFLCRNIKPFSDIKAIWELRKLINSFKPDVLFLTSSKAGFIGSLATVFPSRLRDLRVVYRIGGWSFNDPRPKPEKWLWVFLERLSAKWKDVIIVNNKHDLEQANKLKIKPREKTVLIHNGLDVYKTEFLPKEEAKLKLFEKVSRQSGKIFQADTIIGTIANLYPSKGLEHLIEAAEHFKNKDNIIFFVAGDGPSRQKLENLIQQKELQRKVFLLNQIPDAHKLMLAFDIFVLPSVKEGFPWALIEAMAAKLPVVATNVGAVPEIIEDGKNGMLVEPAKPEQLAGKINDLLNDERLQQELGIQAHQTILFKFSLEKMVGKIEDLL